MTPQTARQTIASGSTERTDIGHSPTIAASGPVSPLTFASWQEKNALLDSAYEEYCRLRESGEDVDPDKFAQRYSRYQRSIRLMLDVHGFIEGNPELQVDTAEADWPEVGDEFLGFRLLDELGQGSFARVFLAAEQELSDRPMAVKLAQDNREEAQTLARLKHPHIVPVYSVQHDAESGRTLICMPYLGRTTLYDLLDRVSQTGVPRAIQPLLSNILGEDPRLIPTTLEDHLRQPQTGSYIGYVLKLGTELADALAHTHAQGICHGDLKPSNVLLVGSGRPMLLDFNLSLQLGDASRLGGTLPYIAPEQLEALLEARLGKPWRSLDERCDLFSLGAILYELLTGKLPFGHPPANVPLTVIADELIRLRRAGPTPIRQLNPRVDRRTAEIVERCLRFHVSDRPTSAVALARELRHAAAPVSRARAWVGYHRRLAGAVFVAAASLGVFAGSWSASRPSPATREYRKALTHFERREYDEALPALRNAIEMQPDFADAYLLRARVREETGNYVAAIEDFRALAQFDTSGRAHAGSAYSLARIQNANQAIVAAEEAIRRGFSNEQLLTLLADSYLRVGKFGPSIENATEAIQLNDRYMPAFFLRAKALVMGHLRKMAVSLDQAAADIRRCLELGPAGANVFIEAALIEILRTRANPQHQSLASIYLQEALEHGMPLEVAKRDPIFRSVPVSPVNDPPLQINVDVLQDPLGLERTILSK